MRLLTIIIFLLLLTCARAEEEPQFAVSATKQLYADEPIKFKPALSRKITNFSIEYWVEDLAGLIVKKPRNTTNLNLKSFTPAATGTYILNAKISSPDLEAHATAVVAYRSNRTKESQCCACPSKGMKYAIEYLPKIVQSSEQFKVILHIDNYDNQSHSIKAWSYVYRGNKVYSKNRTANLIHQEIGPLKSEIIELENSAVADPGEYKLKVKINKDNQKTNKEITSNINITSEKSEFSSIQITRMYYDSPKVFAQINSTFNTPVNLGTYLISLYETYEQQIFVNPDSSVIIDFPVKLVEGNNPFFLKILQNQTLLDIEEIIVSNSQKKPFNLVTGQLVFNSSKNIYNSSAERSSQLAVLILATASIALNIVLIKSIRNTSEIT